MVLLLLVSRWFIVCRKPLVRFLISHWTFQCLSQGPAQLRHDGKISNFEQQHSLLTGSNAVFNQCFSIHNLQLMVSINIIFPMKITVLYNLLFTPRGKLLFALIWGKQQIWEGFSCGKWHRGKGLVHPPHQSGLVLAWLWFYRKLQVIYTRKQTYRVSVCFVV